MEDASSGAFWVTTIHNVLNQTKNWVHYDIYNICVPSGEINCPLENSAPLALYAAYAKDGNIHIWSMEESCHRG